MTRQITRLYLAMVSLYRMWDVTGKLLYVGISDDIGSRLWQHARKKPWFTDVARIEIQQHLDRPAALIAEESAIRTERPAHNIVFNEWSPLAGRSKPQETIDRSPAARERRRLDYLADRGIG